MGTSTADTSTGVESKSPTRSKKNSSPRQGQLLPVYPMLPFVCCTNPGMLVYTSSQPSTLLLLPLRPLFFPSTTNDVITCTSFPPPRRVLDSQNTIATDFYFVNHPNILTFRLPRRQDDFETRRRVQCSGRETSRASSPTRPAINKHPRLLCAAHRLPQPGAQSV